MDQSFGYDANFIEEVADYLKCVICQAVLKEPVLFVDCGHRLCHSCFSNMREYAAERNVELQCPNDRTKVDVNKVVDDKGISRVILDLKVKCDHYLDGCQWTGELRNLQAHLDQDRECIFKEKERTSILLVQLQKRMESYEKRLEQKERRLQICEMQLKEKEGRILVCERQLEEKDQEISSMKVEFYQKQKEIIMLLKNEKDIEVEQSSGTILLVEDMDIVVPGMPEEEQSSSSEDDDDDPDPVIIKALSDWDLKSDGDKYLYIYELCQGRQENLLLKLLETSENLCEFVYDDLTILHLAANFGFVKIINYICSTGYIDVNAQSGSWFSALHFAAGNKESVEALIHHGCNVDIKDNLGLTILDKAQESNDTEIIELIQEAGGKSGKDC